MNAAIQEVGAQDQRAPMNVREAWPLYDTIGITPFYERQNLNQPDGWFSTFQQLAAVQSLFFFNVRNRSIGLAYNNQDKRDSLPYGMRMFSLGITFFSPSMQTLGEFQDPPFPPVLMKVAGNIGNIWQSDLPRHVSAILKINQDERVKQTAFTVPSGYGPICGIFEQGDAILMTTAMINNSFSAETQGQAFCENRYKFPMPMEVPRDANLSLEMRLSDYARGLVNSIIGPWDLAESNHGDPNYFTHIASFFGIQVSIYGQRLVQQRGQYHR